MIVRVAIGILIDLSVFRLGFLIDLPRCRLEFRLMDQKKNACFRNNRDRHTMVRRPSEAALSLALLSATQISKIAVRLLLALCSC